MKTKLLEREIPLSELNTALHEAMSGEGRLVLVAGEAGIGKTSLVEHFARTCGTRVRVLWGTCDDLITPRALGPLHDVTAQLGGEWPSLLGANADRNALFAAFLHELQTTPTVVVVEDVHWADGATLDWLKFLGRRIVRTLALLVITYRDDEVGPRHPLRATLGDLVTSAAVRRINLAPLSESAVYLLARDAALDPLALHLQSGGNPFFVTEVVAIGGSGIPLTVRDAVLARTVRLSASGQAVLEAAAVVGPRIEPWVLGLVTGAEADQIEACLDIGVLVAQGDNLAFRHELARQTILEAISPQQRSVLHRLVLQTFESSPATRSDLARLAHHAAGANDAAAVLRYAPLAARRAAGVHSHREAAAHYALALRFAYELPADERALLREAYATECNITDQRPEGIAARRQALDYWRSAGNKLKQGENLNQLMIMLFGVGETEAAEQVSLEAIAILESLPPGRELAVAYRIQAALRMFNRDVAEAVAWGEKAIALAERFEDDETLAGAYNAIGAAQIVIDYERGREALMRSLDIAQKANLELQVANAYNNLGSASGEMYHYLDAERDLAAGIAFCQEHDLDVSRLYMQAWQALVYVFLGRWDEVADAAGTVLHHPGVSAVSRTMALLALGRLRARRGDPGAADILDEALALAEQTQTLQRISPVRAARAEAAWLAGNTAGALAEAIAIFDVAVDKRHPWFVGELGFWRWRAGDDVTLPAWAAEPFARQVAGDWRGAAEAWSALGCPYERAWALANGDAAAQADALAIFERLGAGPAADALRSRARALSARQIEKQQYGGLTERERQVASLVALGKSNREIAARMTVGVKTVETYITRILNKLGYDSRVQIAVWAVEKGLTADD